MTHFFGFGLFSDFMAALEKGLPVDCTSSQQINPGKHGLAFCYSFITTSQAQKNGVVYHKFLAASFQKIGSEALGNEHADRTQSAYTLTLKLLTLNDFTIRKALQAFPKNLQYVEGSNDLLRYDKDNDLFFFDDHPVGSERPQKEPG